MSWFLNKLFKWITLPTLSKPKRPALPAACVYSCEYNNLLLSPSNLLISVKIVVFTGMLIPTLIVSVQNNNLINPFEKRSSTISLSTGVTPL